MKRRGFLTAVAGLFAAPAVAAPADTWLPRRPFPYWHDEIDALDRYQRAELQAAIVSAMAGIVAAGPLTSSEIVDLFHENYFRTAPVQIVPKDGRA